MAVSKAQQKAVHKYVKANYDRMELTVPKGRKDIIKAHAEARGESVNGFINRSISEAISRDNGAGTTENICISIMTPEMEKSVKSAAEAAGEHPADFLSRAVKTQAERDQMLRRMVQK